MYIFQLPRLIWTTVGAIEEILALKPKCQKVLVWNKEVKGHLWNVTFSPKSLPLHQSFIITRIICDS